MLPVLFPVPGDMAFVGEGVLLRKGLRDGFGAEGLEEPFLLFLLDEILGIGPDDVVIGALPGQAAVQGLDAGQVGIGVGLQVHREIPGGKEGVQAVQHIAELGVLLFQDLPPHAAVEQQDDDIDDEQADQDDLQHHAGMVGLPEHGPGHALGEGLDQDIVAVRYADYAQIVGQALGRALEAGALGAVLEGRLYRVGGALIDIAGFQ